MPERYAPDIAVGGGFTFRVEGHADEFAGRIAAIDPRIDEATRSIVVRGVVENRKWALRPGGFASVTLQLRAMAGGVAVPAEAVIPSIDGAMVYIVADGKAEKRPIRTGLRTAREVQVVSGLNPGEQVIMSNLFRIRPGMPVEVDSPAESQPITTP